MIPATDAWRFARPLSVLFIVLISHTILTVGLPIQRQEHASGSDLIAGEAFLSILMGGRARHRPLADLHRQPVDADDGKSLQQSARASRAQISAESDGALDGYDVVDRNIGIAQTSDNFDASPRMQIRNEVDNRGARETEDGTIIAVRVSSSVGHSMINKHVYTHAMKNEEVEASTEEELPTTTDFADTTDTSDVLENELVQDTPVPDQEAIASEDAPSLVAEANKSEFHVDEVEPISRDFNVHAQNAHNSHLSPPSPVPFDGKTFPGTVIYHNEGGNNRARSVSYSTVIQALPTAQKAWSPAGTQNPPGIAIQNSTMEEPQGVQPSVSIPDSNTDQNRGQSISGTGAGNPGSGAETKDYYVTSKYESPSNYYSPEPTERNWGIPEQNYHEPSKPYTPIVYAQPEQNYEVDEAVSVETNGRAHGVQPVQPISQPAQSEANHGTHHHGHNPAAGKMLPGKKDDNQKVGYVVEGRNYRKYRVEERTSDGFIVGEYGVVRHDDGSLRGVRYTADGTISPRLIYDALMKFLSL